MFEFQGIWFPDGEKHFPEWMQKNGELVDGRGTYQIKKLRAALEHCKEFRVAVDVGAHVGLWSMQLAKRFLQVIAFEPVPQYRDCYLENMAGQHYHLMNFALGAGPAMVSMKIPDLNGGIDSGGTHVCGDGNIEMRTLDSFELDEVDLIKIDCEGYELEVLRGSVATLARCRPCVIVEQKPHKLGPNFGIKGTPAVDFLRDLGAVHRRELGGDHVLSWD